MSTRKLRRKYRPSAQFISNRASRIVRRKAQPRREIDHGKQWYVIRTNISCERRAEYGLRAAGVDVFRPVDDRWRVHRWRCSDISAGWFGRYLFVGLQGHHQFGHLREVDGVECILGVAGTPIAVRPEALQAVADQISGQKKRESPAFYRGQKVNVAAGAFAELAATIEGLEVDKEKATVKLQMFGKEHAVEIDFIDLKAA